MLGFLLGEVQQHLVDMLFKWALLKCKHGKVSEVMDWATLGDPSALHQTWGSLWM